MKLDIAAKQAGHLLPFFIYFSQYEHLHWVCLIELDSDYINRFYAPIHNINLANNGNMTKCPTIFLSPYVLFQGSHNPMFPSSVRLWKQFIHFDVSC